MDAGDSAGPVGCDGYRHFEPRGVDLDGVIVLFTLSLTRRSVVVVVAVVYAGEGGEEKV